VKRRGRTETRILYWFRTPPYVKVGRAAIDEEAMRLLEERHPDVAFDWSRILREPPQQLPEQQALRRREHRDARDARRKKKRHGDEAGGSETPEAAQLITTDAEASEPVPDVPEAENLEPADASPEGASFLATPSNFSTATSEVLGLEAAAHLRNRYVVLMQRIERHPDEAKREVWRREAAPLDPGSWDTAEAVRAALDEYEARYEAIRTQVGGGRRRRRRRGGRGKPGGEPPSTAGV
jgi:hypothetical protein